MKPMKEPQELFAEGRRLFLRALLSDSLSALISFANWLNEYGPILESYQRAVGT